MVTEFDGVDDQPDAVESRDGTVGSKRADVLEFRCVRYPDGPNRCTVAPVGLTGMARMETWLTANQCVFVDLAEWR